MRWLTGSIACVLLAATPVVAAETPGKAAPPGAALPAPLRAAPAAWVTPLTVPAPDPARNDQPAQALLLASQIRFAAEGLSETYVETSTTVQNEQGVAGLANIAIPWQPDLSELVIHKVHIVRAGKTRDLLAEGQQFTVLRRENGLEAALLDGVLTAVLQPADLAVGDTLNLAWSVRQKRGTLAFKPENFAMLGHSIPIRRFVTRTIWDNGVDIRWKAGPSFPAKPQIRKTGDGTELLIDIADARADEPPEDAPARFLLGSSFELSGYRGWDEISALLDPVYRSAQTLAPNSALKPEIDRIAAASTDPRARAMLALRLVQDKIRYLALAMGEGGHVPASADETWSRKFGDCKGKTVTLLALLSGLGIEAEPVLVSSSLGDALPDRLPSVRLFDHVLVRARIGGQSYWLDGTGRGDRDIAALASSLFANGLPIRAAGAALEPMPFAPAVLPLMETELTFDASKGFHRLVPVTGRVTFRGVAAAAWIGAFQQSGADKIRESLLEGLPLDQAGLKIDEATPDQETGAFSYRFSGKTRMDWDKTPAGRGLRFAFDQDTLAWTPKFERAPAHKDVPFQLPAPVDLMIRETILLPSDGAGFTLDGKPIDETLAGTRFTRKLSLEGGRAIAMSRYQRIAREVSAADAAQALPKIRALNKDLAWVRTPADYKLAASEREAILEETPKTASDYLNRGFYLMDDGKLKLAQADFEKAVELKPEWSRPRANLAVALAHQGRFDEAEAALERASALDDRDWVIHQAYGIIHLGREQPEQAVDSLTKALAFDGDNVFTLQARSRAYALIGQFAEAVRDAERAVALAPDGVGSLMSLAQLQARAGRADAAIAAIDKAIGLQPANPMLPRRRHRLLLSLGRADEARKAQLATLAAIDRDLKAEPGNVQLLIRKAELLAESGQAKAAVATAATGLRRFAGNTPLLIVRCYARAIGAVELAIAQKDCDEAVRNDPGDIDALTTRAMLGLRSEQWARTIADCDAALKLMPVHPQCLYMRGLALGRKGDKQGGDAQIARARKLDWTIDEDFVQFGLAEAPAPAPAQAQAPTS